LNGYSVWLCLQETLLVNVRLAQILSQLDSVGISNQAFLENENNYDYILASILLQVHRQGIQKPLLVLRLKAQIQPLIGSNSEELLKCIPGFRRTDDMKSLKTGDVEEIVKKLRAAELPECDSVACATADSETLGLADKSTSNFTAPKLWTVGNILPPDTVSVVRAGAQTSSACGGPWITVRHRGGKYFGINAHLSEWRGTRWEEVGAKKPISNECVHNALISALQEKKVEFSIEEWDQFKVLDLLFGTYIKAGGLYYKPVSNCIVQDCENPSSLAWSRSHGIASRCAVQQIPEASTIDFSKMGMAKQDLSDASQRHLFCSKKQRLQGLQLLRHDAISRFCVEDGLVRMNPWPLLAASAPENASAHGSATFALDVAFGNYYTR